MKKFFAAFNLGAARSAVDLPQAGCAGHREGADAEAFFAAVGRLGRFVADVNAAAVW